VPSDNTCPMPKPGYLNVGRNDFELSEESPGVHILIGLMNGDGEFDVVSLAQNLGCWDFTENVQKDLRRSYSVRTAYECLLPTPREMPLVV